MTEPPPFLRDDYQLLDFGDGRRLERFGEIVLDRPCPAAEGVPRADPPAWAEADARFEGREAEKFNPEPPATAFDPEPPATAFDRTAGRHEAEKGRWTPRRDLPARWTVALGALRFELKRTDFGHVGLFPEQAANWAWIRSEGGEGRAEKGESQSAPDGACPKILNLFAYTGGSTMAAAAAGAEVVHVDAAKNIVAWARRNAELTGLADAPIHWIVEDAQKFVKRELRRGNRYDGLILDPPSYGHGRRGEVWRLSRHLPQLLSAGRGLLAGRRAFVLLTCHTPAYGVAALRDMMLAALGHDGVITGDPLVLRSVAGRELPSGVAVRWMKQ